MEGWAEDPSVAPAGAWGTQPFRRRPIRTPTGVKGGRRAAGHRPSTASGTSNATPWNAGISRLKRNRAVAARFDKLAVRYEATVHIAAINEWL